MIPVKYDIVGVHSCDTSIKETSEEGDGIIDFSFNCELNVTIEGVDCVKDFVMRDGGVKLSMYSKRRGAEKEI